LWAIAAVFPSNSAVSRIACAIALRAWVTVPFWPCPAKEIAAATVPRHIGCHAPA
jgi:hypothetical protein